MSEARMARTAVARVVCVLEQLYKALRVRESPRNHRDRNTVREHLATALRRHHKPQSSRIMI